MREAEKKSAMETCLEYSKYAEKQRGKFPGIFLVEEGKEHVDFVAHFHGWGRRFDPEVKKKNLLKKKKYFVPKNRLDPSVL